MNRTELGSSASRLLSVPIEAPKTASSPSIRPRWMSLAHAAWGVTAVLAIVILVGSLTGYAVWLRGGNPLTSDPGQPNGFHVLSGATSLATALVCLFLGFTLFRQRRNEPMALFVSFYVITYGVVFAGPLENLSLVLPGINTVAVSVIQPLFLTVPTVCLVVLLPDGRPIPRWTGWLIPLSIASMALLPFMDASSITKYDTLLAQIWGGLLLVTLALALTGQVYRYRNVSTQVERSQMRWAVFGFATWMVLLVLSGIPYIYLQNLPAGTPPPAWVAANAALWWLSLSVVPATLTIAILRYRLYEIDVIINRALVYGALTAILAGMYSASISLFQKVFVGLTGEKSDAAIVITTLILASGFTPIKSRLQAVVDRRFRDSHDPGPSLSEFSKHIEGGIWVIDVPLAMERLLNAAVAAFDATGGEVVWQLDGREPARVAKGVWTGTAQLMIPILAGGTPVGSLTLAGRRNGSPYTSRDAATLSSAVESLSRVMSMTSPSPKA